MPEYRRPEIPRLGGNIRDIRREGLNPKPKMDLHSRASQRIVKKPLAQLDKAAKVVSERVLGKSGAVARVLGSRLGARLLPALAIAITARDVARATQEGVNAHTAYKDLERTRVHMRQKYGTKARATATRHALTRR
jgi:hypothetical protein